MFSVVIPGKPCLTDIVALDGQPSGQATKFAFSFPFEQSLSDIVVFFLPGTVLPPDTAVAIYIQMPDPNAGPNGPQFRFIGALANEKPSGIFKVRQNSSQPSTEPRRSEAEEEDEMLDEGTSNIAGGATANGTVTLGISIEPAQAVAPQLAELEAQKAKAAQSTDLVRQPPEQRQRKVSTKVLAQRIIGNAFKFLASFASSDSSSKGQEVVPLKSFQDWWNKFERRVEMDPGFLEKEDPNAV